MKNDYTIMTLISASYGIPYKTANCQLPTAYYPNLLKTKAQTLINDKQKRFTFLQFFSYRQRGRGDSLLVFTYFSDLIHNGSVFSMFIFAIWLIFEFDKSKFREVVGKAGRGGGGVVTSTLTICRQGNTYSVVTIKRPGLRSRS